MDSFTTLLQQGNAWLFVPSAIALGALHGLEPGHSKTMMAAFIIAIRGTLGQVVLLGLSATLSHTAVVWLVALAGLHFGQGWNAERSEPYFQVASAATVMAVAGWMIWRTWREDRARQTHAREQAQNSSDTPFMHRIDTGHGMVRLELHGEGDTRHFRLRRVGRTGHVWAAEDIALQIRRPDGRIQDLAFEQKQGFCESVGSMAAPFAGEAHLTLGHGNHRHSYTVSLGGSQSTVTAYQDAHERAHAEDIQRRFAGRSATTGQIVLFGLTGGLVPCPASITVLLLCLHLKQVTLGLALVLCFSIGLALTMVASGALAALGMRHAEKRFDGFGRLAQRAPYLSGALILLVGIGLGWQGLQGLS